MTAIATTMELPTPENPQIVRVEDGLYEITWFGSRVPRKVDDLNVGYMRDGVITFQNGTSGVYERTVDSMDRTTGQHKNTIRVRTGAKLALTRVENNTILGANGAGNDVLPLPLARQIAQATSASALQFTCSASDYARALELSLPGKSGTIDLNEVRANAKARRDLLNQTTGSKSRARVAKLKWRNGRPVNAR